MNFLDLVIAGLLVGAAVGGYRLGFVTRVLSWVGLVVGLLVAIRLLPTLLRAMGDPSPVAALAVTVGTVFVGTVCGQALGALVGSRLRPVHDGDGGVTPIDGVAGAAAGAVGVAAIVWLLIPVAANSSEGVATMVRGSAVVQALDERLPPAPDTMQALRTLVGEGDFPQVFESLSPTPDLGPPPEGVPLDAATIEATAASTVRISAEACGRVQQGSGFVVAPGLVVTNAHVVAGQVAPTVHRSDGVARPGQVVSFDPQLDLALLAVDGLDRAPLLLAEPAGSGVEAAVFGHPGGEPLRIAPARVVRELAATGRDIYGRSGADRQVLELASELRPGDSGGPLVDAGGSVIGVVFAIASDRADVAYALASGQVADALGALADGRAPTAEATVCLV
ncbi:MAG: MarP family serine protease [Acidimicrobiia bacterium]|nr:MarP family serine protease [Acidimicrobiia bacterium]